MDININTSINTNIDTNTDKNTDTDTNANINIDKNIDTNTNIDTNIDTNTNTDKNTDTDKNIYKNIDTNANTNIDTNIDTSINNYITIIQKLLVSYEKNDYIKNKIHQLLISLPEFAEQENKKYEERLAKFNEMLLEQDNFFKIFLSKHQYYYMPFNNIYYEYNGKTFKTINGDCIYYKLLSTITYEVKLIQWKHKTKQIMIKKIKERPVIRATPETETIQSVITFLKTFFETKAEVKYFLTIIGDCILKKNNNNLYFVSSSLKKMLGFIDSVCYITTGNTILNNFITKYHDSHNLHNYRLLRISDTSEAISYDIIKNIITDIGIDLLVVATHYSEQYSNADNYLSFSCDNSQVKDYSLYLLNNNIENIVSSFMSCCIEVTNTIGPQINWNNMHYIWKQYMSSLNIPNILYTNNLQQYLMKYIQFTNEDNHLVFIGVTSKYLPNVSSFLSFWDKYITIEESDKEYDYEIDELCALYKSSEFKNVSINDSTMINMIIHYFYQSVDIIEKKYITNIKCSLWNKEDDICEYITYFKTLTIESNDKQSNKKNVTTSDSNLISFDDLYQKYRTYFRSKSIVEKKQIFIVSKQYFEKYLLINLSNFIQFEKFLDVNMYLASF